MAQSPETPPLYPPGVPHRRPRPLCLEMRTKLGSPPLSLEAALRKALAGPGADLIRIYRPSDRACKVIFLFRGEYLFAESSAPPSSGWTPWALEDWLYGDLVDHEISRLIARIESIPRAELPVELSASSDPLATGTEVSACSGSLVSIGVAKDAPERDRPSDLPGPRHVVLGVRLIEVLGSVEISAVELSEEARRGLRVGGDSDLTLASGSVAISREVGVRVGILRRFARSSAVWIVQSLATAWRFVGQVSRGRRR